jgi:putative flippase GtrA
MRDLKTRIPPMGARLAKSIATGGVASLVDMAVLVGLVEFCHVTPEYANFPSLIIGSLIQFWGNRHFAFGVTTRQGVKKHLWQFAVVEIASLAMNGVGFYAVLKWTNIHYVVARPLVITVIYLGFSFPAWGRIFKSEELA